MPMPSRVTVVHTTKDHTSFEGCSWWVTPFASSEWVFATVDLSEAHVAKYFDVTLDDCFIKSSGDELNIQIIDAGRPVFSFVKVRSPLNTTHTHN